LREKACPELVEGGIFDRAKSKVGFSKNKSRQDRQEIFQPFSAFSAAVLRDLSGQKLFKV
jgi:hypothetical protein